MKTFLLVSALLAVSLAVPIKDLNSEWNKFKVTYGKNYATKTEENLRKEIFLSNCRIINEHNALYEKGQVTYKMGIRKFADLTSEEFVERVSDYIPNDSVETRPLPELKFDPNRTSLDWRDFGVVTDVKDQGDCKASYAFSTTGGLEGYMGLLENNLQVLSEQQFVDCSTEYGNQGCDGGSTINAFQYLINITSINKEDDYPFDTKQEQCRFVKSTSIHTISTYCITRSRNELGLKMSVDEYGPVPTSVATSNSFLHLYAEGVYSQPDGVQDYDATRHNILVIGFGNDDQYGDFWLIKDSYGTDFADGGYWKLARNQGNQLGIASEFIILSSY